MTDQTPANWYPDPFGRHEHRYWDGTQRTHHVATRGAQKVDLPVVSPAGIRTSPLAKRVPREVRNAGVVAGARIGGGTLLTEPVLVISRTRNDVFDQYGQPMGARREVGQNLLRKAMRADTFGGRRFHVVDPNNRILNEGLGLLSGKQNVGSIRDEDGKSRRFMVRNSADTAVARISRKREGASFVMEMHEPIDQPLRTLVVASAITLEVWLRHAQAQARLAKKYSRSGGDGGGD